MTAGFLLLLGAFFLWLAFTDRARPFVEAVTGVKYVNPSDQKK